MVKSYHSWFRTCIHIYLLGSLPICFKIILLLTVRAVEDLKVELNPAYPQNRDLAAQHMAAFVTSFIKFDLALTSLTIKDSATYGFRPTDEDILTICSAITGVRKNFYFIIGHCNLNKFLLKQVLVLIVYMYIDCISQSEMRHS